MKELHKRKLIWCRGCDTEMVEVGAKCGECGKRAYSSKVKKPNKAQILKDYLNKS